MASIPMTDEECRIATDALSDQLDLYANLLIKKGVALKPGQELVVEAPVERADFARRVVDRAYRAGAGHVTVIGHDDAVTRLTYENVETEWFKTTPSWQVEQLNSLAEAGAAFLFLEGSDPSSLKGIDPAKPAAARKARNTQCRSFRDGMDFGRNVWCIAGVPVAAWAREVFPGMSDAEAVYRLWNLILATSRADGEDPESAWETHNASFEKTKRWLNQHHFDALRYRSSNGTDFTVGLTAGHIWDGGAGRTVTGTSFFPNIPTEEVFTAPLREGIDGVVYSALPLVHNGNIIENFHFVIKDGRIVDVHAEKGEDILRAAIAEDEGASYFGEVALVPYDSPIRNSGLLFYNTLYDENASCHLAFGEAYPECIAGGERMTREELDAHGLNHSLTHVDFMVGTADLSITGTTHDGRELPVFRSGNFAL